MVVKTVLLDDLAKKRAIFRISHEIIEKNKGVDNVVLIGIVTRGVPMANEICVNIEKFEGVKIPCGSIDITLYRDDLSEVAEVPKINATNVDFDIVGKNVVLVDDVLYTGRTARAAIEAVLAIGRPKTIQLAVLIDRGHRELPIRADYVGKNIPTSQTEVISVNFTDIDGEDNVKLCDTIDKIQ